MPATLNHVGLTVLNIEDTLAFYRQLTTVEVYEEPVHVSGDGVGAVIHVIRPDYLSCMARIGGREFELIEHFASKGRHVVTQHNDSGGMHLAFTVDNLDEVFARIKAMGITPTTTAPYTAHDLEGYRAFFFRDINDIQIEIAQTY